MADYTLHCFAQSGNAYKAALMLSLCGADWQPRLVDYFNGETRTPAYRAINPMGEVPVLEQLSARLDADVVADAAILVDNRAVDIRAVADSERRKALLEI